VLLPLKDLPQFPMPWVLARYNWFSSWHKRRESIRQTVFSRLPQRLELIVTSEEPAAVFQCLFETHLHVANLERAMKFYGDVLGLELGLKEAIRRAAFYWIGSNRTTMLGIWEVPPWVPPGTGNLIRPQHLAFEVSFEHLPAAIDRLKQRGIEVRDFFDHVTDEPSVFGWMPAASIYFNDVDGHLLELIAKLDGQPAADIGVISLTEWEKSRRPTARSARPQV
jgi:lactoylglutathione lyase